MFTGIVQAIGRVKALGDHTLAVRTDQAFVADGLQEGESIAVNGVCLTLLGGPSNDDLLFDVSPETFRRSNLGDLEGGQPVNLERAMTAQSLLGGHIVQGHVDATGTLVSKGDAGEFRVYRFQGPAEYDRYLIDKGSVSVNGVSLTVVEPKDGAFDVWLVPHTLTHTGLGELEIGAKVNLEFDVLAKHVEKLLAAGSRH